VIVPYVLYGCETCSLALREIQRMRVFGNRVMRIFGPKSEEGAGSWRRLDNVEFYNLYTSPNFIINSD
jgi:hypothetical protein